MSAGQQIKRFQIGFLSLLLSFMVVACVGQASPTGEATPTAPPVEYGASLSEWEAAVRSDSGQAESSNVTAVAQDAAGAAALPAPIVVTVAASPVAAVESGQAEGSNEAPISQETVTATVSPTIETATEDAVQPGEADVPAATASDSQTESTLQGADAASGYRELAWEDLVPADYTADAIMAKYQEEMAKFEDGDPAAMDLYTEMQNEFNNAPVNDALDNTMMKLPGFIAPLEYTEDLITEFLLVPYFGACIHVPAPPANQTVLVRLASGTGITIEDAYEPVWVLGLLTAERTTTELASAGYYVQDARVEPYTQTP